MQRGVLCDYKDGFDLDKVVGIGGGALGRNGLLTLLASPKRGVRFV
jgi:hypothetical protein